MKKTLLTKLGAAALMLVASLSASAQGKFTMEAGATYKSADQVTSVPNITLTFGEAGGNDFTEAKANTSVDGYTAFTEGNGTNGNKAGGTFYVFDVVKDGSLEVAVVLNADKAFFVIEDGTALDDYNGTKVTEKYYGTYKFDVKAGSQYKVYCSGSKLGFYGFEYTVNTPTVEPVIVEGATHIFQINKLYADVVAGATVNFYGEDRTLGELKTGTQYTLKTCDRLTNPDTGKQEQSRCWGVSDIFTVYSATNGNQVFIDKDATKDFGDYKAETALQLTANPAGGTLRWSRIIKVSPTKDGTLTLGAYATGDNAIIIAKVDGHLDTPTNSYFRRASFFDGNGNPSGTYAQNGVLFENIKSADNGSADKTKLITVDVAGNEEYAIFLNTNKPVFFNYVKFEEVSSEYIYFEDGLHSADSVMTVLKERMLAEANPYVNETVLADSIEAIIADTEMTGQDKANKLQTIYNNLQQTDVWKALYAAAKKAQEVYNNALANTEAEAQYKEEFKALIEAALYPDFTADPADLTQQAQDLVQETLYFAASMPMTAGYNLNFNDDLGYTWPNTHFANGGTGWFFYDDENYDDLNMDGAEQEVFFSGDDNGLTNLASIKTDKGNYAQYGYYFPMPVTGKYSLTVNGFSCDGKIENQDSLTSVKGPATLLVNLYARSSNGYSRCAMLSVPFKNIMAGAEATETPGTVKVNGSYLPANDSTAIEFIKRGNYRNEVIIDIDKLADENFYVWMYQYFGYSFYALPLVYTPANAAADSTWTAFDGFRMEYVGNTTELAKDTKPTADQLWDTEVMATAYDAYAYTDYSSNIEGWLNLVDAMLAVGTTDHPQAELKAVEKATADYLNDPATQPAPGSWVSMNHLLKNRQFDANLNGWNKSGDYSFYGARNADASTGYDSMGGAVESNGVFDFSQEVNFPHQGYYFVGANAFQRMGKDADAAWADYNSDKPTATTAQLYIAGGNQSFGYTLPNVFDQGLYSSLLSGQYATGDPDIDDYKAVVTPADPANNIEEDAYYVPNSLAGAYYFLHRYDYFYEAGYSPEVLEQYNVQNMYSTIGRKTRIIGVPAGTFTIGIKNEDATPSWTVFDDIQLNWYNPSESARKNAVNLGEDNTTTSINEATTAPAVQKSSDIYSLSGQKFGTVSSHKALQKGVYVIDGKKVVIK